MARNWVSRRDIRDTWRQVAKIRERNGDKKGAAIARRAAREIDKPPGGRKRTRRGDYEWW
jgi:hypothetical protein